jgi:DNA-binding SARP family transcriptional activator/Tfp pilus assembly protein PilF
MLRVLGTPIAHLGEQGLSPLPLRALVLVALLRLEFSGVAARGLIATALWEEQDEQHALTNLRQLIRATRNWERAAGCLAFDARLDLIVRDGRHLPTDLDQFLAFGDPQSEQELKSFNDLYRGELLQGIGHLGSSLDQWIHDKRMVLADRFAHIAIAAAERIPGATSEAILRRIMSDRPYDDAACRALMRFLATYYSTGEALRVFEAFHRRLFDDLHVLPGEQTLELAKSLHSKIAPGGRSASPAPQAVYVPRVLVLQPVTSALTRRISPTEILASALVEEATLNLSRMREFAVVAPHTAAQIDVSTAEAALGAHPADYIVFTRIISGTSPKAELEVRLAVARSGEILWLERLSVIHPGGRDKLHGVTCWLAVIVASSIQRAEMYALERAPEGNAYRHYLMGRHCLREISLKSVRRARRWFRSAIDLDPHYAPALSWLAHSFVLEWMVFSHATLELLDMAEAAARAAIAIDPLDGNGHRALGRVALFQGKLDQSLDCFEHAVHFVPHQADMLADYADTLMHNSQPIEAKRRIEEALDLNPLAPDVYRWIAGGIYFFNREPAKALSHLKKMANPDQALRLMAACAVSVGNMVEAHAYRERAIELDPDFRISTWTSRLPQRERSHLEMYAGALRDAGFV